MADAPQTILVEPGRDEQAVARAAEALRVGGLVVLPTDTVYGLAAALDRPEAISAIFEAKQRPADLALPVLLADAEGAAHVALDLSPCAGRLMDAFWPGALTVVVRKSDLVPDAVTAGRRTVGLRVPDCDFTRRVLAACGGVLAVTSANLSGAPPPRELGQVPDALLAHVALIIDAGPCPGGVPSTVVDLTADPPRVLREGAIAGGRITQVLEQHDG